ncbi:thioredoxin family protein [Psychroserpens damuponensis]|uniref:thioredoxin family protein n=1 Tax=Psychroserpens damuponensis TaxID=943936 RepID=UPI0005908407|nr:thioredoxin family protein [Psychroserpens damuponensis]
MKKIVFILALAFSLQISAQDKVNWITDYKAALQQSKNQNKPILAFVTNTQKTEATQLLKTEFFASEAFKTMSQKVILLKLDISDKQSYNVRLGIHYLNKQAPLGLALVNKYSDKIGDPLTEISTDNITNFISFVNSKI